VLKDLFGQKVVYWGLLIDLFIIASFFILGKLSYKKKKWAMIVGLVLYSLDLLTFLVVTDYLSIAFHALALYSIFRGIQAADKLKKLEYLSQIADSEEELLLNS
jgi:4-amino-4-deoxy-L-arabinose transferase-like glycosyltransferase